MDNVTGTFVENGQEFGFIAEGRVVSTLTTPRNTREDHKRLMPPSVEKKHIIVSVGGGVHGDYHAGPRKGDKRELFTCGLPPGSAVVPWRQFTAVSVEECREIARLLGIETVPPGALGENLILEGIGGLTGLPATSLLHFFSEDGTKRDAVLAVWGENRACGYPGGVLTKWFYPGRKDLAKAFADLPLQPIGLRGITGLVFSTGKAKSARICAGDTVRVQWFEPR